MKNCWPFVTRVSLAVATHDQSEQARLIRSVNSAGLELYCPFPEVNFAMNNLDVSEKLSDLTCFCGGRK